MKGHVPGRRLGAACTRGLWCEKCALLLVLQRRKEKPCGSSGGRPMLPLGLELRLPHQGSCLSPPDTCPS